MGFVGWRRPVATRLQAFTALPLGYFEHPGDGFRYLRGGGDVRVLRSQSSQHKPQRYQYFQITWPCMVRSTVPAVNFSELSLSWRDSVGSCELYCTRTLAHPPNFPTFATLAAAPPPPPFLAPPHLMPLLTPTPPLPGLWNSRIS